jgi:hypothetical protein
VCAVCLRAYAFTCPQIRAAVFINTMARCIGANSECGTLAMRPRSTPTQEKEREERARERGEEKEKGLAGEAREIRVTREDRYTGREANERRGRVVEGWV